MSWIATLGPFSALLAAVPLGIILLYFLKLRREPVDVPSTYLWSKTIEDLHVNSLLQRLRRSLLLLLQLLVVALAAIAVFRPGIRDNMVGQGRTVFLLDTSASMQATDLEGRESRFDKAKRMIAGRIESMDDSETAMLVTFSDRAETVQSFTSDRRRLSEALERVSVTNRPTDILGALQAADGLANPRRSSEVGDVSDVQVADAMPADLLIYSDGGFQSVTEFSLGNLIPEFVSIGSDRVRNLSITAFSAERNVERPSEIQAFATVMNLGTEPLDTSVTLSSNGDFLDADTVSLQPGEQTGLSFTLDSDEAMAMRLQLDSDDDFALDNVAFAGLTPLRTVSVLVVTDGNSPLELGLGTFKAGQICQTELVSPDYLQSDDYKARADAGTDDLIIYDRCSPEILPATNTFFIASLPPPSRIDTDARTSPSSPEPQSQPNDWSWGSEMSTLAVIDVDRTHPMMRFLELYSLLVFSGRAVDGPTGSLDLVAADIGPVMVLAPRDGYQDLVLGFEIVSKDDTGNDQANTNWYAERSWPVFLLNVLRYLAGAAEAAGANSYQPGETVRVRLESLIDTAMVTRVGGESSNIPVASNGTLEVVDTEGTGNYRVESEDRLVDLFAVNLFDRRESEIIPASAIELGYEAVEAVTEGVEQRREFWRLALIAMLGLLAVEWWIYARRVG